MIARFRRIQHEFGTKALLKTLLLLFGLVAMAVMGIVMLESFDAAVTAVVGLALGALVRRPIVERVALLPRLVHVGLTIYAVVLFLGGQFGMDNEVKLLIVTFTTVVLFDFQFWALSDPGIYNPARTQNPKLEAPTPSK